jgi:hypothetical protein
VQKAGAVGLSGKGCSQQRALRAHLLSLSDLTGLFWGEGVGLNSGPGTC